MLIPLNVFFILVIVFFSSALFFIILSNFLLKFFLHYLFYSQVSWTSLWPFFKIFYQTNYLSPFNRVFLEIFLFPYLRYSSVFSLSLTFYVFLYELCKISISPTLQKVALCRSHPCITVCWVVWAGCLDPGRNLGCR